MISIYMVMFYNMEHTANENRYFSQTVIMRGGLLKPNQNITSAYFRERPFGRYGPNKTPSTRTTNVRVRISSRVHSQKCQHCDMRRIRHMYSICPQRPNTAAWRVQYAAAESSHACTFCHSFIYARAPSHTSRCDNHHNHHCAHIAV